MNKNYAIIVAVLVLIIIGSFFYVGSRAQNAAQNQAGDNSTGTVFSTNVATSTTTTKSQMTVTYNGKSFSPSTITIRKGDTVTFVNQSTGKMNVASDPHPTHTDYPEFDQTKSSQIGSKTYTFTFQKVGTWGYHNHDNPSAKGKVIVNP